MDDKLAYSAITFDDVLLEPRFSEFMPAEVEVSTNLTRNIRLATPMISSPMDTVTESEMAIALAKVGGLGIIHKNLDVETQSEEVTKVKRSANGIIVDHQAFKAKTEQAGMHAGGFIDEISSSIPNERVVVALFVARLGVGNLAIRHTSADAAS